MGFACPCLDWFLVCLGIFCCWHNTVSPKSCMPYFSLIVKPLSLICLNLLSSSDLKLALLLGLWVQWYVSESVIRDLDALFSVLLCVVSVSRLFFSKSSGFYSLVFQVRFFWQVSFPFGWSLVIVGPLYFILLLICCDHSNLLKNLHLDAL